MLAGIALASFLIAGCVGAPAKDGTEAVERIRISGARAAEPLVRVLAAAYPEPDVSFVFLPGGHSDVGIQCTADGDLDVGVVARSLTETEIALGLTYVPLSRDGLVVAVHPSVTIEGLTIVTFDERMTAYRVRRLGP